MRKKWILAGLAGCCVFIILLMAGVLPVCAENTPSGASGAMEVRYDKQAQKEDDYNEMVEDVIKSFVADGYEVSYFWIQDAEYMEKRDWTEPKVMLYQCDMTKTDSNELAVPFCIWVEKTDEGYAVKTDFKQSLFRWALMNSYLQNVSNLELSGAAAYLTPNYILLWKNDFFHAFLPADSGYASPYYGCLGEDMILCSRYNVEDWESVYKDAYQTMYEYQKLIEGDLSQNIRFAEEYDASYYRGDAGEEKEPEDFENWEDYDAYITGWTDYKFELAYKTWLEDYEAAGGKEYYITFDTEYGEAQRGLLEVMCRDREFRSLVKDFFKKFTKLRR